MKTLILSALILLFALPLAGASAVTRSFSKSTGIYPGEVISVTLSVAVTGGERYYVIDETIPSEWVVTDPDGGSVAIPGHIRWAVAAGAASTLYTYQVRAPGAVGIYTFSGKYVFEGMTTEGIIGGAFQVQVNRPLADFSDSRVHLQVGKSAIVKIYMSNPNATFANVTVWLGGSYPSNLANFSSEAGIILSPNRRTAVAGLNPKEEKVLSLVISSVPAQGVYTIILAANTTANAGLTDQETMSVSTDYAPSFPGLELYGIALIMAFSGFAYWKIQK